MFLLLAALAIAQDHITLQTEDGGTIFADLYSANSTRGVVLAHGGQFKKESWEKQARELVNAGFRVIAFDFRGFGKSHGPGTSDLYTAPLHLDVLAAVRFLHNAGTKSVSVVGGSMGGGAAADATIFGRPGEIERVIVLGAAAGNGPPEKIQGRKLFIVARDDKSGSEPRLPGIMAEYEKIQEPKRMILLEGSAHAQFLFRTDQGGRVMREILEFLAAK